MRQSGSVEIVLSREEHLRLRLQSSESRCVNDPVAVDLERRAIVGFTFFCQALGVECSIKFIFHSFDHLPEEDWGETDSRWRN